MKFLSLLRMAFSNLSRRKLRTFLTCLSVMIGTASIVLMLSLGFAIQKEDEKWLRDMDFLTSIEVSEAYGNMEGMNQKNPKEKKLDDKTVKSLENIDHVTAVLPKIEMYSGSLRVKKLEAYVPITGVDPKRLEEYGVKLEEGSVHDLDKELSFIYKGVMFYNPNAMGDDFNEEELNLLQERVTYRLGYEDNQNILTGEKTYKDFELKAVGKIESNNDFEQIIYMNIDSVRKLLKEENDLFSGNSSGDILETQPQNKKTFKENEIPYTTISVRVDDIKNVKTVQSQIEDLGYQTFSMSEMNEGLENRNLILNAVLGGIGAISLLVAAIGIANTMIMSIYERTKEIGVMKVIGASLGDIRNLFLIEAGLIGFIGGIFGIILSYIVSNILNSTVGQNLGSMVGGEVMISYIPAGLAIIAAVFSLLIGLLFGYFPAKKATKISAIEAIRTN